MTLENESRSVLERTRWKSHWSELAQAMKRAVLGRGNVQMGGHAFRVAYEARKLTEEHDYKIIGESARDARCVFDVGANVGITALVMASSMDSLGKLYAFEPSEAACLIARENALLNGLAGRIEIVNAVVSDQLGQSTSFHWFSLYTRSGVVMEPPDCNSVMLNKVSLTLDSFAAQFKLSPDLVKIDVEGAESQVISGMQNLLQEARPNVILELHTWPGMSLCQNVSAILPILAAPRYKMIRLRTKRAVKSAEEFSDVAEPDSAVWPGAHVMLLPSDRDVPKWLDATDTTKL